MAVLDSRPEFEVKVLVEGEHGIEYDENDPDLVRKIPPETAVKYIEAVSDANFPVTLTVANTDEHTADVLMMCVYADGKKPLYERPHSWMAHRTTCLVSRGASPRQIKDYIQKYKFDFIGTVETELDDPKNKEDEKLSQEWGTVEVRIHRINRNDYIFGDIASTPQKSDYHEDVAEKTVKRRAISHGVRFDEIEKTEVLTWWKTAYPDGEANSLATFVFNYRPKRALRELCIISAKQYAEMLTPKDLKEAYIREMGGIQKLTKATAALSISNRRREKGLLEVIMIDD